MAKALDKPKIEIGEEEGVDVSELLERKLTIFNDDVNSFGWVIKTLVTVLGHTPQQAEQCANIIHHTGKCVVKTGLFDELKPYRDAICERGIDVRIV